jgi:hypothetical protein
MKHFLAFLALAVSFSACQQKKQQYFASSPEIDLVKKLDQSFATADWTTYRNSYADTAQIWFNTWGGEGAISVDTLIANLQSARNNYTEIKLSDPAVYEMIETDAGDRWVHRWGRWDVTHKNGKDISWASHAAFLVSDGKIRGAGYIFNSLPGYLANQDSTMAK